MGQLEAGVARTIVTPPLGTYLIGYAARSGGCRSVHDDLSATALVLYDGATQLVIIPLDMLALNERIVARVRDGIEEVMICCSHTHSGPVAYADEKSNPEERRFVDGLVEKLVSVVGEAQAAAREPAVAAWAQGEAHIAVNRRQLLPDERVTLGVDAKGPVDRSLDVVELCRCDDKRPLGCGRPLATLVNFACHATVVGSGSSVVSAEWPGVMRREVEWATGAYCMLIQGAAGDLNPRHDWAHQWAHQWGDDDLASMERLGSQVAEEVLLARKALRPFAATPLQACREVVWLPAEPRMNPDGPGPLLYNETIGKCMQVPESRVDAILEARFPWKATMEERSGRWYAPTEIQAFGLGDCALISHSAETFNEIGAAIEASSPAPITLFAGYTNGCVGYVPTSAAHALGGYEVELAPYFYRMPGPFDPACEALVLGRSLRMLEALASASDHHQS